MLINKRGTLTTEVKHVRPWDLLEIRIPPLVLELGSAHALALFGAATSSDKLRTAFLTPRACNGSQIHLSDSSAHHHPVSCLLFAMSCFHDRVKNLHGEQGRLSLDDKGRVDRVAALHDFC